ncbi:MAG: T9SS type A sorting domain-containing protein [bacterium]|nr:T9SS type A sorting domain-containing protein [bacterium]
MTTPVHEWEVIGFVESYGNPNSLVEYSFTDITQHRFPVVQYRLKMIDNDGSFQYSQIIEINTAPTNYELSQNYPNPFNPNTVISYKLPVTGNVTLKVYDILGNEVGTLVNENKEPGTYEVEFQSNNLTSGVYIYQLNSSEFVQTKKMLLLR